MPGMSALDSAPSIYVGYSNAITEVPKNVAYLGQQNSCIWQQHRVLKWQLAESEATKVILEPNIMKDVLCHAKEIRLFEFMSLTLNNQVEVIA